MLCIRKKNYSKYKYFNFAVKRALGSSVHFFAFKLFKLLRACHIKSFTIERNFPLFHWFYCSTITQFQFFFERNFWWSLSRKYHEMPIECYFSILQFICCMHATETIKLKINVIRRFWPTQSIDWFHKIEFNSYKSLYSSKVQRKRFEFIRDAIKMCYVAQLLLETTFTIIFLLYCCVRMTRRVIQ